MNVIFGSLLLILVLGLSASLLSMLLMCPVLYPITRHYYNMYLKWLKSKGFDIKESDTL